MIQIRNLTITHKKDLHVLVSGFDLVLNEGDRAVIVGEEGNGKSTLLKWIYDPRLIEDYAEAEGERVTQGEKLAYLPQELPEADRDLSAFEFVSAAAGGGFSPKDAARLASQLGIDEDMFYSERPMRSFSGGEKVKLRTAALLLGDPDVLLLDEPSNDRRRDARMDGGRHSPRGAERPLHIARRDAYRAHGEPCHPLRAAAQEDPSPPDRRERAVSAVHGRARGGV
jgi:ATPase subunit of ABC transporter with duplicated ATPase domains